MWQQTCVAPVFFRPAEDASQWCEAAAAAPGEEVRQRRPGETRPAQRGEAYQSWQRGDVTTRPACQLSAAPPLSLLYADGDLATFSFPTFYYFNRVMRDLACCFCAVFSIYFSIYCPAT